MIVLRALYMKHQHEKHTYEKRKYMQHILCGTIVENEIILQPETLQKIESQGPPTRPPSILALHHSL